MLGLFLSFEGIDGAGKSSHIPTLAQALRDRGFEVLVTREPGGTALSEKLRSMILNDEMDMLTETLLVFAARRDHIKNVIRPALARGEVVLCDRFTDSTVAYQGFGRGFDTQIISKLEQWVQMDSGTQTLIEPDLTLWFDLAPKIAAQRLQAARSPDRFESQMETFFDNVRLGYDSRLQQNPVRMRRIEADQPYDDVFKDVISAVNGRFEKLLDQPSIRRCSVECA